MTIFFCVLVITWGAVRTLPAYLEYKAKKDIRDQQHEEYMRRVQSWDNAQIAAALQTEIYLPYTRPQQQIGNTNVHVPGRSGPSFQTFI